MAISTYTACARFDSVIGHIDLEEISDDTISIGDNSRKWHLL
ncbi:unnamed protein product [Acidithrix sp. C25]|nr:unnamed protein product [Acidithrix sp. C25]